MSLTLTPCLISPERTGHQYEEILSSVLSGDASLCTRVNNGEILPLLCADQEPVPCVSRVSDIGLPVVFREVTGVSVLAEKFSLILTLIM